MGLLGSMPLKALELTEKNFKEQIEKNLKGIVKEINNFDMIIGIPAAKKKGKDTVADYAYLNEFGRIGGNGVPTIPARPFLRTTFVRYKNEAGKIFERVLRDMAMKNSKAKPALEQISIFLASLVQKNIVNGDWPANAPFTIKKKGSSKPLIDSGTMRRSVTGWVKRRSGK